MALYYPEAITREALIRERGEDMKPKPLPRGLHSKAPENDGEVDG